MTAKWYTCRHMCLRNGHHFFDIVPPKIDGTFLISCALIPSSTLFGSFGRLATESRFSRQLEANNENSFYGEKGGKNSVPK